MNGHGSWWQDEGSVCGGRQLIRYKVSRDDINVVMSRNNGISTR